MLKRFFLSERNVLVAVLLNAVVIYLLYFPSWEGQWWLETLDQVFLLFFVVEAIVKIIVLKPKLYFANPWNRFDFLIVVGSLPTLLIHIIDVPNTSILIILRLFRLFRVIRLLRFVPNLGSVLSGLGRALKASVFVLLILIFLNFILALVTCHFYGDIAPDHFGNPAVASYSIFQLFTVEGWHEIAETISSQDGNSAWFIGLTRFYFVIIVLLGGVFGMSLANAVFVDEMTMDNNNVLEAKIDELQRQIADLKGLLLERHPPNEDAAPPEEWEKS